MNLNSLVTLVATLILLTPACNEKKFKSGGQDAPSPKDHLITINGIDDYDAGYKTVKSIDSLDFSVQETAFRNETGQTSEIHAVDLYFVVDVTASMKDELVNIRQSLPAITSNLRKKNVDLWAGFIGFVDGPSDKHTKPLTGDINSVTDFIANIEYEGNFDNEEGAIAAGELAANRFLQGDGRADAAKIILMITDVVGHDGSGSDNARDCRISPFVKPYNALAQKVGSSDKIKFFYTVPDPANYNFPPQDQNDQMAHETCSDSETGVSYKAKSQMEAIMEAIAPAYAREDKGGPLLKPDGEMAWELKGDVLTSTLVPMIEKTVPVQKTLSCMAQEIAIVDDAQKTLYSWNKQNNKLVPVDNNAILLNDAIADGTSGEVKRVELLIDRCCMEVGADNRPVNDKCVSEYTQTVKYKITYE